MGFFTLEEFLQGMGSLSVDSLDGLKKSIPNFEKDLADPNTFREIYQYVFDYAKETPEVRSVGESLPKYCRLGVGQDPYSPITEAQISSSSGKILELA